MSLRAKRIRERLQTLIDDAEYQRGRFWVWVSTFKVRDPARLLTAYDRAIEEGKIARWENNYPRMVNACNELMFVCLPANEISLAIKRLNPEGS